MMHSCGPCALCGHAYDLPACGHAENENGEYLCHADDHSCYVRWTVHGDRK